MARIRRLNTASQVIDQLGGNVPFQRRYRRTKQQTCNYRRSGRLPSEIYELVRADLAAVGCVAAPRMFGMIEPGRSSAA